MGVKLTPPSLSPSRFRARNAKFSGYYFYMNTNIQRDFQICICVSVILLNSLFINPWKNLWLMVSKWSNGHRLCCTRKNKTCRDHFQVWGVVVWWLPLLHKFLQLSLNFLRRSISCSRRIRDLRWWGSLTMVSTENQVNRLLSVIKQFIIIITLFCCEIKILRWSV